MEQKQWKKLVGSRLQQALNDNNTSVDELSTMTGMNRSNIYSYIRGETTPSLKAAINIVKALNIRLSDLVSVDELIKENDYE